MRRTSARAESRDGRRVYENGMIIYCNFEAKMAVVSEFGLDKTGAMQL